MLSRKVVQCSRFNAELGHSAAETSFQLLGLIRYPQSSIVFLLSAAPPLVFPALACCFLKKRMSTSAALTHIAGIPKNLLLSKDRVEQRPGLAITHCHDAKRDLLRTVPR